MTARFARSVFPQSDNPLPFVAIALGEELLAEPM